jgi:hypothetical protein
LKRSQVGEPDACRLSIDAARLFRPGHASAEVPASLGVGATAVRMAKSRVLHRLKEQFGELIQ